MLSAENHVCFAVQYGDVTAIGCRKGMLPVARG